jgi:hypothetical protein
VAAQVIIMNPCDPVFWRIALQPSDKHSASHLAEWRTHESLRLVDAGDNVAGAASVELDKPRAAHGVGISLFGWPERLAGSPDDSFSPSALSEPNHWSGNPWLTPMEDQQLAGLVMWIPAGLTYPTTICWLFMQRG